MKVKNIMFFGFAAAILTGTANAAIPFQIASKAYVDGKFSDATSATTEVVGDMEQLDGDSFGNDTDTVVEALNDLDDALATKQDKSDSTVAANGNHITAGTGVGANLTALDTALGTAESAIDTLEDAINGDGTNAGLSDRVDDIEDAMGTGFDENNTIADALAGKVNVSDKATTIRGVDNASDDKWATELAVATIVNGITGGEGTVSQQIADALGSDFTGQDAYADVTAALATKQNLSDSTVAANGNHITAGAGVGANLTALDTALGTVEGVIGDSNSGLAKDVADLQDTVGDSTDGLVADVEALRTLTSILSGYSTCVANSTSHHCVLTAAQGENGQPDTLSWTDVTDPFEVE